MRLSGNLAKSASDLFAELFPAGTVPLDVSQTLPSDASSVPTASSNPAAETTAQSAPPHPAGLLADNGADGPPPDLDSATAGTPLMRRANMLLQARRLIKILRPIAIMPSMR